VINHDQTQFDAGGRLPAAGEIRADIDIHARVFEAMEMGLFQRANQFAQGNQAKVARGSEISRQTMREKLQSFGLKASADKADADEGVTQVDSPASLRQASCAAVRSSSS
jgi:DNA-binding NtrC family response regulator